MPTTKPPAESPGDAIATGQTPADELEARRISQREREATAEFDPDTGAVNGNGEGESVTDRAAAPIEEEADGQLFVPEHGRRVGLADLFKRGTPVTFEVKLTGKVLKGPGNLVAFSDPDVMLVVPGRAGPVVQDPVYDEDGNVKEVHVRQTIKARTFYDARSDAARIALQGE